jgi:FixJ family two-component response regulator
MTEQPPVVIIVDDDESFRTFLARLVGTIGLKAIPFASAEEFLTLARRRDPLAWCLMFRCRG